MVRASPDEVSTSSSGSLNDGTGKITAAVSRSYEIHFSIVHFYFVSRSLPLNFHLSLLLIPKTAAAAKLKIACEFPVR